MKIISLAPEGFYKWHQINKKVTTFLFYLEKIKEKWKVLKLLENRMLHIKAIVEGVNIVKKHTKQSATQKAALRVSKNLFLYQKIIFIGSKNFKTVKGWF